MKRACEIRPAGGWQEQAAIDQVFLNSDERFRRRMLLTSERRVTFLLDLPRAMLLREGDGLVLEDGSIVRVIAKPEPLVEISAANEQEVARLAWHLGNRHTDLQIVGAKLRIRRDHVLEAMLRGLGATITEIEAPFHPEGGAYEQHDHE
ncbi:MAG: urease accessory protein UreE [Rhizobiales bacterium]|nr:urease accessory protein UreE [Hyphomicrobiales bacterium]